MLFFRDGGSNGQEPLKIQSSVYFKFVRVCVPDLNGIRRFYQPHPTKKRSGDSTSSQPLQAVATVITVFYPNISPPYRQQNFEHGRRIRCTTVQVQTRSFADRYPMPPYRRNIRRGDKDPLIPNLGSRWSERSASRLGCLYFRAEEPGNHCLQEY